MHVQNDTFQSTYILIIFFIIATSWVKVSVTLIGV